MGDIKCLTAYKLGCPAVEHPVTWCQEGILETRQQQANCKGQRGQAVCQLGRGICRPQGLQKLGCSSLGVPLAEGGRGRSRSHIFRKKVPKQLWGNKAEAGVLVKDRYGGYQGCPSRECWGTTIMSFTKHGTCRLQRRCGEIASLMVKS